MLETVDRSQGVTVTDRLYYGPTTSTLRQPHRRFFSSRRRLLGIGALPPTELNVQSMNFTQHCLDLFLLICLTSGYHTDWKRLSKACNITKVNEMRTVVSIILKSKVTIFKQFIAKISKLHTNDNWRRRTPPPQTFCSRRQSQQVGTPPPTT